MIVDPQEILVALRKTTWTEADRALLTLIHPLAEASLAAWMQQHLEYQLEVEYLPIGNDMRRIDPLADSEHFQWDVQGNFAVQQRYDNFRSTLQLSHTPVWLTGLEVWEDTSANAGQASEAFRDGTKLSRGSDYWLDIDDHRNQLSTTGLLRRHGAWPDEPRCVKVSYYGGWTAAQMAGQAGDIKLSAIEMVVMEFNRFVALVASQGGTLSSETIGKYAASYRDPAASGMAMAIPLSVQSRLQGRRSYNIMG